MTGSCLHREGFGYPAITEYASTSRCPWNELILGALLAPIISTCGLISVLDESRFYIESQVLMNA
jgi:hypothetical protein